MRRGKKRAPNGVEFHAGRRHVNAPAAGERTERTGIGR